MKRQRKAPFPQAERLKDRVLLETPPPGTLHTDIEFFKLKFQELPLSAATLRGLAAEEFVQMTPIQMSGIPHALAGRDLLGAAVTGSGKSLAFLVPLLENLYREKWGELDGLGALVITPTRELGMQLFEVLRRVGKFHSFAAGLVIGGKDLKTEQKRLGQMNILIGTPGRLLHNLREVPDLTMDNLKVLIIDEADMILNMGFEETLNDILGYLPSARQTLLFSATLSQAIQSLAGLSLRSPEYINVLPQQGALATQSKLIQHYTVVALPDKLNLLFSFIKAHLNSKIIVFFSSAKQVRFVHEAFKLLKPGALLLAINGKQKQHKRTQVYYKFVEVQRAVLFATDVAARGLDFPAIGWVVQVDCPEDVSSYVHRVGRTARYKASGNALLFLLPSELKFLGLLQDTGIRMKEIKPDPKKTMKITGALSTFTAQNTEIKHLAQKHFKNYIRSVFLMPLKQVFNVEQLNFSEFAESLGLASAPQVTVIDQPLPPKKTKLAKLKEKIQQKKAGIADGLLLTPKRIDHAIEDAPCVRVSNKQLKKIKPEGHFAGYNKTIFEDN